MKALVKDSVGIGCTLKDIPVPEIKPDELLVKVLASGICGSDKDIYNWEERKRKLKLPFVMGHELFGEVVEVGAQVKGFSIGDKISSDSHIPCGECYLCRTGKKHLCMQRGILGHQVDGCFAEYLALPAVAAFKMPAETPPQIGALMEPLGVVYHAVMRTSVSGKSVLILGLGTLGFIMADAVRNLGASRVIVCSTNDGKLKKAVEDGANFGINSKKENTVEKVMEYTNGAGADVVFEMSGNTGLYNLAIDCAAYGGAIVAVGMPKDKVEIERYPARVIYKELIITSSFGRLFYETWELMRDLLDSGKLNPAKYVGEAFPLEEYEAAFEASKTTIGRVILLP